MNRVALTFDAEHPDRVAQAGAEESLLDVLDRLGVRATFFLQGRWVEANPKTALRITESHTVGSHSHYHCPLPLLSDEGLVADFRMAEKVFRHHLGLDPKPWFRCPFGAGSDDPRVLGVMSQRGYVHVGWDVFANDWQASASAVGLVRALVPELRSQNDSIVLMHAWPSVTLRAVPALVESLRETGVEFVGVDELPFPPQSSALWR